MRPRTIAILRLGYGGALAAAPGRTLAPLGLSDDLHAREFARILGVRHAFEGIVALAWGRGLGMLGVAVDGTHAASVLVWAAFDERHRRALLLNAVVATGFAVLGARS